MRRLLCTALLLLCCAYGCIAAVVQPLPQKGQGPWDTYIVSATDVPGKVEENWQPIRFAVSAKEMNKALAYCRRYEVLDEVGENEEYGFTLENDQNEEEFCDAVKTMTDKKKIMLLRDVLPAALKLHSERLRVEREKLELSLNGKEEFSSKCPNVSIPKEHQQGIPNADFMLYVGLIDEHQPPKICSRNTKGRPTSALIKFVPKEIDDTRYYIRFTAHEVAHALGFEIETMTAQKVVEEEKEKKVLLAKSKTVLDKVVKEHYGCSDYNEIKGVTLQNKPGDNAPLHWKRLIAKGELMSPYNSDPNVKHVTGAYYTALTLAVFDSMPFYSANFDMAENMSWGKNVGCEFLKGKDKDKIITQKRIPKKYSEMFCDEVKPAVQCTSDRFALGRCTKEMPKEIEKKLPLDYLILFNSITSDPEKDLMDDYPIIKPFSSTSCEKGTETQMPGSVVGKESRCLKGENLTLKEPNEDGPFVGDICAKVKCDKNTKKVSVQYSGTKDWQECKDGKVDVTGSTEFASGSILCPNYTEVCNDFSEVRDINFTIEYDEDVKLEIKKEKEAEDKAQEKKQREEEDRKKNEQEANGKAEEEEKSNTQSGLASQTQPQHHVPALAVDQRGSAVADKENVESHVSPASLQARDQRGSSAEGEKEVDLHPPAVPELQPAGEENQPPNSNINNSDGLHRNSRRWLHKRSPVIFNRNSLLYLHKRIKVVPITLKWKSCPTLTTPSLSHLNPLLFRGTFPPEWRRIRTIQLKAMNKCKEHYYSLLLKI
ncbi:surface protease GP63 [Trypanosoma theileri]|uniref:Leishmanolysin-like peptidase n=1 Tax=Trypanosoma theileri TaxID=67003 RepID=A0A1X0NGY3_9TRYP|nr:surface protease GP63 [Trypanosoma theileri]ORC83439.1 surface protease GP63 [Trypanosoma theileri]